MALVSFLYQGADLPVGLLLCPAPDRSEASGHILEFSRHVVRFSLQSIA